jgi:urease accessory protein UreE
VKQLLQILSGIKENTERALSIHGFSNNVYHIGNKHYPENFQESVLDFTSDALSLSDF